jgi:MFS family permease
MKVATLGHLVGPVEFFFGAGLGLTMQVVVTAVQNNVERRHMGTATASVTFFRSMGGAIGTALFGAILSTRLATHLAEVVPVQAQRQLGAASASVNDITAIRALTEPVKGWVLSAFTSAMDDVFLAAVPFMAVALVIALTKGEKPLAGRDPAPSRIAEEASPEQLVPVSNQTAAGRLLFRTLACRRGCRNLARDLYWIGSRLDATFTT